MKHTIQIFFFMLSFGIVSLGSANAQRTYTLDECLEQALSNNVRMKKDVEAAVEAGITTRNDLLQIRLRQNETQSSRIQVENALSLSRNLLAQYMGLGSDSVDVTFSMDNQLPENPSNLFEVPENALARTSEYHLLQQNLKASRLQKDITIGKNLPTVALGGGYYYENLMDRDHRSFPP